MKLTTSDDKKGRPLHDDRGMDRDVDVTVETGKAPSEEEARRPGDLGKGELVITEIGSPLFENGIKITHVW